jgi:hypothetical protein
LQGLFSKQETIVGAKTLFKPSLNVFRSR